MYKRKQQKISISTEVNTGTRETSAQGQNWYCKIICARHRKCIAFLVVRMHICGWCLRCLPIQTNRRLETTIRYKSNYLYFCLFTMQLHTLLELFFTWVYEILFYEGTWHMIWDIFVHHFIKTFICFKHGYFFIKIDYDVH